MSTTSIVPRSQFPLNVRAATMDDLPFMDSLQKLHTKQVGWMPTAQFEGKIKLGHVLIAEESGQCSVVGGQQERPEAPSLLTTDHRQPTTIPVGYCIGNDQYFKRDDVGIIYQLNVLPNRQRGFIGATLIKAMLDRAAYGCKLFCCWCAQDIAANNFWESLGFIPLAFRAGSRGKQRVHIFWQRRIRAGDTQTPYWFPSQTTSGSIREDRIVLPIPPGTHWSDAKPMILPGLSAVEGPGYGGDSHALPAPSRRMKKAQPIEKRNPVARNGVWFDIPKQGEPIAIEKPKQKTTRVKVKNDPKLVAAARELRDRWLEKVNSGQYLPEAQGKYEISRQIAGNSTPATAIVRQLPAAA